MLLAHYGGILIKVVLYISNNRKLYVFCMLFTEPIKISSELNKEYIKTIHLFIVKSNNQLNHVPFGKL